MDDTRIYMITSQQLEEIVEKTVERLTNQDKEREEYLTAQEVSEKYGISATTLWRMQKAQILKPYRIGNRRRYALADIERVMREG